MAKKEEQEEIKLQVDLEKLAQPDNGDPDSLIPGEPDILTDPTLEDITANAPDYDPNDGNDPPQDSDDIDEPEVVDDNNPDDPPSEDPDVEDDEASGDDGDTGSNDDQPVTFKGILEDAWGKSFGEEEALPEDTSEENMVEHIGKKYAEKHKLDRVPEELKPVLKEMEEKGLSFEDVVKSYKVAEDIRHMDSEEVVRRDLKSRYGISDSRPDGWSDEKIENSISKMKDSGLLDIQAEQMKSNADKVAQAERERMSAERKQQQLVEQQKEAEQWESNLKSTASQFSELDSVWGFKVSETDKKSFESDLREFVTPKDGKASRWQELMSDDLNFAKIAYIAMMGEDGVQNRIHEEKEQVKDRFMQRLDESPRKRTTGKGGQDEKKTIDYDALAGPELLIDKIEER